MEQNKKSKKNGLKRAVSFTLTAVLASSLVVPDVSYASGGGYGGSTGRTTGNSF